MKNSEITVGIKTFFRTDKLKKCLKSLENKDFKQIIAVDNGIITEEKREVYEKAKKKLPLKVIDVKFDSGIGFIQNKMIPEIHTPYLLVFYSITLN